MPLGYIIAEWTEDEGLIVPVHHPENLNVDLDDMMRIFYAHITGAGESGNVLVRLERSRCNVTSHFTGMDSETPIMINLLLELGEDPDHFGENIIQDINKEILKYTSEMIIANTLQKVDIIKRLKAYLKNSLFLLERLKHLTKEQKMAQIYSSEKGRAILESLQERARPRKELLALLEDKLGKIISNLEITLDPFIKTDLIKQDWIAGFSDILLFLTADFSISRAPPLAKNYLEVVRRFFVNYTPTLEDNLTVANNMINPDKFDYIVLFREKPYPLNKIPKGPGESFKFIKDMLKSMEEDKIITIILDKNKTEWVFLLSDPITQTFYPEYMIEQIRKDRMSGLLKKEVAVKHLELLESGYVKE